MDPPLLLLANKSRALLIGVSGIAKEFPGFTGNCIEIATLSTTIIEKVAKNRISRWVSEGLFNKDKGRGV